MGCSSTLNRLQSKHCPHKCVDVEVNEVDVALIKAAMLTVNPNITACLSCLQPSFFNMVSIPKGEVYDVPSQARRASLFTVSSWKYTQQNASNALFVDILPLEWVLVWCLLTVIVVFYLQASTTPRHMPRTHSLLPISELEKRFDSLESLRCSSPGDSYVSFRHLEGLMK